MSNKIRMLPDNWTYEDYFKFVVAFQQGDNAETFRLAQKLIVSWDYSADLNAKNAIMQLGVGESAEVIRTIMETIGKYIDDLDIKPLTVSFDAWNTEKFFQFDTDKRTGKFAKTEPMLKEVVKWDKLETATYPMSFTIAATAYKAIAEAYKQIVSGKN